MGENNAGIVRERGFKGVCVKFCTEIAGTRAKKGTDAVRPALELPVIMIFQLVCWVPRLVGEPSDLETATLWSNGARGGCVGLRMETFADVGAD